MWRKYQTALKKKKKGTKRKEEQGKERKKAANGYCSDLQCRDVRQRHGNVGGTITILAFKKVPSAAFREPQAPVVVVSALRPDHLEPFHSAPVSGRRLAQQQPCRVQQATQTLSRATRQVNRYV